MSLFDLADQEETSARTNTAAHYQPTDASDVRDASFDYTTKQWLTNSAMQGLNTKRYERANLFKELTGKNLNEGERIENPIDYGPRVPVRNNKFVTEPEKDKIIEALRTEDPEKYKGLLTTSEMRELVELEAHESFEKLQRVRAGAPDTNWTAAAGFMGGVAAQVQDPVNMLGMAVGAGAGMTVFRAMLTEGAVNMGLELGAQPFISDWQKKLGNEYGIKDMAQNLAFAGVFGAGATGLIRGGSKLLKWDVVARKFESFGNLKGKAVAKFLGRKAHIEESNLGRVSDEIPAELHERALNEMDLAQREGRPINYEKIGLDNEKILGIRASEISDPYLRSEVERLQRGAVVDDAAKRIEEAEPVAKGEGPADEILNKPEPDSPSLARVKEIEKANNSPEARAQEIRDFDAEYKGREDEIIEHPEHGEITVGEFKKRMQAERDVIDAISSCGVKP